MALLNLWLVIRRDIDLCLIFDPSAGLVKVTAKLSPYCPPVDGSCVPLTLPAYEVNCDVS